MNDLLAVTLGNTSVAAATVDADGALRDVVRAPLEQLEALLALRLEASDGPVAVCSVNPPALARLRRAAEAAGCKPPLVAGEDFPISIRTDVDEPDRVGTDRLLAALAAYHRAGRACIVIDVGTAVTVDAVDDDGTFLGGAIFPGPGLMARSLADGTAQLPLVEIASAAADGPVIGRNTEAAIRSGITRAMTAAVARLAGEMRDALGTAAPVYVTGGYATPQDAEGGADWTVVPDLVLEGLVLAWRGHQEP
jgi:type III pantothenate kinase